MSKESDIERVVVPENRSIREEIEGGARSMSQRTKEGGEYALMKKLELPKVR